MLLLAVTGDNKQFEGTGGNPDVSSQVQTVVNWYGPTDLARMYGYNPAVDPLLSALVGGTPQEHPEQYKAASPVTYVTKDACPVLTLHGTVDKLVPVDQASEFDAAMKKSRRHERGDDHEGHRPRLRRQSPPPGRRRHVRVLRTTPEAGQVRRREPEPASAYSSSRLGPEGNSPGADAPGSVVSCVPLIGAVTGRFFGCGGRWRGIGDTIRVTSGRSSRVGRWPR